MTRPEWLPRRVRSGDVVEDGPFEGIPKHLRGPLLTWMVNFLSDGQTGSDDKYSRIISMRLHLGGGYTHSYRQLILDTLTRDPESYLDALDMALELKGIADPGSVDELREILRLTGSVWTVDSAGSSLTRRVSETETTAIDKVTESADQASKDLRLAWNLVYSRNPDARAAWQGAIRALEELYVPIVVPKKQKATLGDVIGELRANPGGWKFRLTITKTGESALPALIEMLQVVGVDPGRHGGGETVPPTHAASENVVQLAVTLAGWARTEALVRA